MQIVRITSKGPEGQTRVIELIAETIAVRQRDDGSTEIETSSDVRLSVTDLDDAPKRRRRPVVDHGTIHIDDPLRRL